MTRLSDITHQASVIFQDFKKNNPSVAKLSKDAEYYLIQEIRETVDEYYDSPYLSGYVDKVLKKWLEKITS